MKGYFSSIAKQSGLRYLGQSAQVHALSGDTLATPIEREETVLVPPSMPGNVAQTALNADRADKQRITPIQGPLVNVNTEQKQRPPAQEQMSTQIQEQRGTKVVLPVYSPNKNFENNPPVMVEKKVESSSASSRLSVVEQTILEKPGQSEEASGQILHRDPIQPAEPEEARPSESSPALETEKKEYFSRTAAIIENGENGAADIQTILFQEVQEWVASSPVSAGTVQADVEGTKTDVITKVAQPKEPGVVTIRDSAQSGRAEYIQPMEQNFELSIGTINVIIEESEKPRQPEPPTQQNNKAAVQENGFRFTRLNRSYL